MTDNNLTEEELVCIIKSKREEIERMVDEIINTRSFMYCAYLKSQINRTKKYISQLYDILHSKNSDRFA